MRNRTNTKMIEAENGEYYPSGIYYESRRATGPQIWVANNWADGALPTHSCSGARVKLYTSTENFCGYQYPDGRGLLKHYQHIQAIRTKSGMIIGDSSCYGKGWAHCTYPDDCDARIDLTMLQENLKQESESIYEITDIEEDEVTFESGRVFSIDNWEWIWEKTTPESSVLGV